MNTQEIIEAINAIEPVTKGQIMVYIISAVLGSSVINGIVTHILYNRKLKKEQKVRSQNVIWDKIAESLESIRDIELKCQAIEIYNIEDRLQNEKYMNLFGGEVYYPAIMNNFESFNSFFVEINNSRMKWGKYLDPKVAVYLYYMQNYCLQLVDYLNKNHIEDYPRAGMAFIFDIQAWQKAYEKLLVKRINSPKHKVYVEDGIRWKLAKKKIMKRLWNKSILNGLINNMDDLRFDIAKTIIFGFDDDEIEALMIKMDTERKKKNLKNAVRFIRSMLK